MTGTVLQHAAALARRHGAHVVVAHCWMRPEDLVPQSGLLPSFARTTMMEQAQGTRRPSGGSPPRNPASSRPRIRPGGRPAPDWRGRDLRLH
ncbi:universal stress protein [Jannaschia seohaensis]|uniref:universal stress protein n=1 Tax=Jannaschia seohaensis TaxID=475081 RepID=UPI001B86C2ED